MKVLVIAAHADDPEIAMGGTIAKFIHSGNEVRLLVAIIPCEDIHGVPSEEAKRIRREECINSAKFLGAELEILDLDPYQMCFGRDLVKLLDQKITSYAPDIVFTHWEHDSHQDHVALANATFAATRKNNVSLLMYEQLTLGGITPHTFKGNVFFDISDMMETKLESVKIYSSQMQRYTDRVEAIKGIAAFRGNQIGVKYAEAFEVVNLLCDVKGDGCRLCSLR